MDGLTRRKWRLEIAVVRVLVITAASVGGGACFGVLSAVARTPELLFECGVMGAYIGLGCAPALLFGLWRGPMLAGASRIFWITAAVSFFGGLLVGPGIVLLAVPVYIGLALRRAERMRLAMRPDPSRCAACGYSLVGLPGPVCPECGHSRKDTVAEAPR